MTLTLKFAKFDSKLMVCPACDDEYTHVEEVQIAARGEDEMPNEITVDAVTGRVETHGNSPAPTGTVVHDGRRQRIAVTGHCESGGHNFAIVFTQHKGQTLLEVVLIDK
ncbi:hypothetical protein [Amycolatopsis sp. NBC_01286]|uniref:hypothetical protein n=1 Tax=Amycolatopsis sp. NBC_01286 TaxID=2903560 RepID=UPI002E140762|nr:hypothetical protein OG570_14425 [Amycolatopsis sp. NBC_01286]